MPRSEHGRLWFISRLYCFCQICPVGFIHSSRWHIYRENHLPWVSWGGQIMWSSHGHGGKKSEAEHRWVVEGGAQGVHREYCCCDGCGRGVAMAQPVSSSTLRNASPGLLGLLLVAGLFRVWRAAGRWGRSDGGCLLVLPVARTPLPWTSLPMSLKLKDMGKCFLRDS